MKIRDIRRSLGAAAAIAAALLTGANLVTDGLAESGPQRHYVEIRNLEFSANELVVSPGDTIVWVNRDFVPHTVTADDATWDSDLIDRGDQWQTLVREGMGQTYFCAYHPSMTGRLRILPR